jgi:hypothetical protein
MEHAIHFLERLRRADQTQSRLALELYGDSRLVKYILAAAKLPQGAERVAISLDSGDRGPFILVTNPEGKFVTCLGHGMLHDLPSIEFASLQALIEKVGDYRRRAKIYDEVIGPKSPVKLFREISELADDLSREQFLAASALVPATRMQMAVKVLGSFSRAIDAYDEISRWKTIRKRDRPALRSYWEMLWLIGNYWPMVCMDGPDELGQILDLFEDQKTSPTWALSRLNERPLLARGVWVAGMLGEAVAQGYIERYLGAESPLQWLDSVLGLMVIALRHPRFKNKILDTLFEFKGFGVLALDYLNKNREDFLFMMLTVIKYPDRIFQAWLDDARVNYIRVQPQLHAPSHLHFDRPEDVPEDLACTLGVNLRGPVVDRHSAVVSIMSSVPWLARARAEDLFLSQTLIGPHPKKVSPEYIFELVQRNVKHYGPEEPKTRKEPKVGRNDPCPCGSGKKYKKCCQGTTESKT